MFSHNWVKIRSHQVTTEEKNVMVQRKELCKSLARQGGKQFQSSSDVKRKVDVS